MSAMAMNKDKRAVEKALENESQSMRKMLISHRNTYFRRLSIFRQRLADDENFANWCQSFLSRKGTNVNTDAFNDDWTAFHFINRLIRRYPLKLGPIFNPNPDTGSAMETQPSKKTTTPEKDTEEKANLATMVNHIDIDNDRVTMDDIVSEGFGRLYFHRRRPYLLLATGYVWDKERNMVRHYDHIHRAVIYKCCHCGLYFNLRHQLEEHYRKHLRYNPHICDDCGRQFQTKRQLQFHINWCKF